MANIKELKSHMASIRDMQKITNAMYLISSTKRRKAKSNLEKTRPYFEATKTEIKRCFQSSKRIKSKYFCEDGSTLNGTYAALVITADKGLAGAYNLNVLKETEKLYHEHPDTRFYVVGEYGRNFMSKHNIPIEKSFLYTAQDPTVFRAREIAHILLDVFNENVDKILIIYTDMNNSMVEEALCMQMLPFEKESFEDMESKKLSNPFEFYPDVNSVLNNIIPGYLTGFIYSALVDSFCSEQNARMNAMNSANQNAENILADLSVEYNRVRQAAITQEITEISAGAKAQKNKRKKMMEVPND